MRLSTGLVNRLTDSYSLKDALAGYVIDIYSGVQPTLPDNVPNGTLLCTVSNASGAYTAETASAGSLTITAMTTGNTVATVTVNAVDILGAATPVPFNTSINQTATDVAAQINRNPKNHQFIASTTGSSGVITITAANGMGSLPNTWAVAGTGTTTTFSNTAMSGGVNAVSGLDYDVASAGVISKLASQTWSGNAGSAGFTTGTATAGWFRIRGGGDAGTASSTTAIRIDGSIGTSGADMNLGSLTLTYGAPFVLPTATLTLPQQ